jgi:indole-3-glycerol phosphate synthase
MTILNQIVASKRAEVDQARRQVPLERLKAQIADEPWAARDFYSRLTTPGPGGVNIIAEVKRASPSKGLISADLDAGDCARAYEAGGAAAISVLTDTIYFKGSLADLRQARAAVQRPVLRKEFIISAYQVYESRAAGADALLLIVRILEPGRLAELLALTHELGMAALVEIHSPQDYESAHGGGARLIGINNRNLATFDTDIRTAMDLAALLQAGEIPVAASGISSRQDIEANLQRGIFNFLVGESLVRAENRAEQVSRLIRG